MFSRWGGALIPFLLAWMFKVFNGWAVPFLLIAALGVLWCGAFWPWFRDRPEEMPQVNRGELKVLGAGRLKPLASDHRVPWERMAGSLSVWSLCLMYGFTGFSGNFFTSMLPLYLSKQRHLSDSQIAWLSALPLAAGSLACILGGTASDWAIRRFGDRKWGRRYVGFLGLALAGPLLLAVNRAQSVWLLALLLTATFFCNDLSMGPAWACVRRHRRALRRHAFRHHEHDQRPRRRSRRGDGRLPVQARTTQACLHDFCRRLWTRGALLARRRRHAPPGR